MTWLIFGVGIFVGVFVGVLAVCLCHVAADADRRMEREIRNGESGIGNGE